MVLPCTLDPRQTETPLDDLVRSVTSTTVDPHHPERIWAVAAIHDPLLAWPSSLTWSLYRSLDGGATWAQFAPGLAEVLYAPSDPRWLYLARESGLWRSTDAGETFLPVSPLRLGTDFATLEVDAQDPLVLMMGGSDGVRRSRDGGATWSLVNAGLWRYDRVNVSRLVPHPQIANLYYAYPTLGGTFEAAFP